MKTTANKVGSMETIKKPYVRPGIEIVCIECEYGVLKHIYSMDVDEDGDFEGPAGAKKHFFEDFADGKKESGLWE